MKGTSQESPALHFRVPYDVFVRYHDEAKHRGITLTTLMWEKLSIGGVTPRPTPRQEEVMPLDQPRNEPVIAQGVGDGQAKVGTDLPVTFKAEEPASPAPCVHARTMLIGNRRFCKDCERFIGFG